MPDKELELNHAEETFIMFLNEIIDGTTRNLIEADKDQPGNLLQSIGDKSKVYFDKGVLTLEVKMEDYWKYVEEGRKPGGKMPFPKGDMKPILDFINVNSEVKAWARTLINKKATSKKVSKLKTKRIRKAVKQKSVEMAYKQAAFIIGKSIKEKGIKPTHFYSSVVTDEFKNRLKIAVSKALARDIEINIKESFT